MDIAVSGSHGLIGTALADALVAEGHRVAALNRPGGSTRSDAIAWDPVAGTIDSSSLEGIDAVVHLAGAPIGDKRWSDERKRTLVDSRVEPTRLLAETLGGLDRPPKVLVSGSAIGYYGSRGDEVLTETSGAGSGFLAELCRQWEAAAEPARVAGIRVSTIRTGVVLSADGGALAKQLPLFRFGLGGRMGSGRQYQSWISITDEVAAIAWLLHRDLDGPVNLTAPSPVTSREFAKTLGQVLHRPTFLPTPAFGPKLVFGRELVDELLLASQRIVPAALEAGGFTFAHPDLETALRSVLGRDDG
jgi:uncharacterized protein (TIGR01777 family)